VDEVISDGTEPVYGYIISNFRFNLYFDWAVDTDRAKTGKANITHVVRPEAMAGKASPSSGDWAFALGLGDYCGRSACLDGLSEVVSFTDAIAREDGGLDEKIEHRTLNIQWWKGKLNLELRKAGTDFFTAEARRRREQRVEPLKAPHSALRSE